MTEPRNEDGGADGPSTATPDTAATPPASNLPTAPANTVEAVDPLTPLPGEHGIPSVTRRAATRLDWRALSAVAIVATILVATLVMWISRQLSPHSTSPSVLLHQGMVPTRDSTRNPARPVEGGIDLLDEAQVQFLDAEARPV